MGNLAIFFFRRLFRKQRLWLLVAGFVSYLQINALAQPVLSTDLINKAKDYDQKIVIYEGEVIGDVMQRGGHAWLNINDGYNAIGVWADKNLLQGVIKYTGSYRAKGDWLEVGGIFNRACRQHGGDMDIHAQTVRKIKEGRLFIEKINPEKKKLILILLILLSVIWILGLFIKK